MNKKFLKDCFEIITLSKFNKINKPIKTFKYKLKCPYERQYILRRMIKNIHEDFVIDEDIEWCRSIIKKAQKEQEKLGIRHPFCYITIRHGTVTSETDDEWHTDGFSQVITHIPEQNYIATSNNCTEYVLQPIKFPKDFDGLKHNIHLYIQEEIDNKKPKIHKAKKNIFYLFSPYCIHRRPIDIKGKQRTFVRITFTPIEICDDDCDKAEGKYNRTSNNTRLKLIKYSKGITQ